MRYGTLKRKSRVALSWTIIAFGALASVFVVGIPFLVLGIVMLAKVGDDGFLLWKYGHPPVEERPDWMRPSWERTKRPFKCVHRSGLPVADGTAVSIDLAGQLPSAVRDWSGYVFSTEGDSWRLDKAKITSVSLMTEREVQTHLSSRPGMALAGAVLAGIPGAIVGGAMTKRKDAVLVSRFLVFDYVSGDPKSLVFEYDSGGSQYSANGFWNPKLFARDFEGNRGEYAPPQSHTL